MGLLDVAAPGKADLRNLEKLARKNPELFKKAHGKALLQLMTWMNTGSPREARTPPIKTGVLRGSATAFSGGEVVGTGPMAPGATPAASAPKGDALIGYIVYNTEYAAKMHEWEGGWGEKTEQAIDAGRKWMELHLRADRDAFTKMIAVEYGKGAGL